MTTKLRCTTPEPVTLDDGMLELKLRPQPSITTDVEMEDDDRLVLSFDLTLLGSGKALHSTAEWIVEVVR